MEEKTIQLGALSSLLLKLCGTDANYANSVINELSTIIVGQINFSNFDNLLSTANTYKLDAIANGCIEFIAKNIDVLMNKIDKISYQCMLSLLNAEVNVAENKLFFLTKKWIEVNEPSDINKNSLLKLIRLPLITPKVIVTNVEPSGLFTMDNIIEAYRFQALQPWSNNRSKSTEIVFYIAHSDFVSNEYKKIIENDIIEPLFLEKFRDYCKKYNGEFAFLGESVNSNIGIAMEKYFMNINQDAINVVYVKNNIAKIRDSDITAIADCGKISNGYIFDNSLRYSIYVKSDVTF